MANKITVTSAGTVVNANVTPDYAQYYSEKAREWAISNRIVDNTDYSSKYYANESKKQADISTAKATEVIESGNTSILNIESARDNAITDIANQETTSKTSLIDEGATQVGLIQNEGATQIANVQSTGFYMKDDKLYYVNSQGEEVEFKDAAGVDEQLANKADIDLNNLNSTGVEKFDSPWVSCNEYQIFSNVGLSSSTYSEYTLDFLPDNGVFELNCMYMTNAGANSGYARLVLNDESESYRVIVGANTGTAQNTFVYGQVNLIVSNKKVKAMKAAGGYGNEKFSLIAVAYRKVGTGFEATTQNEET